MTAKPERQTYDLFGHVMDLETFHCINCGRYHKWLQDRMEWHGTQVHPLCRDDVIAISHRVRSKPK